MRMERGSPISALSSPLFVIMRMEKGSPLYEVYNLRSLFPSFFEIMRWRGGLTPSYEVSNLRSLFSFLKYWVRGRVGFSLQSLQSLLSPPLVLFVTMIAGTEGAVGLPLYEVSNLRFFYPLSFYNESRERDSRVMSLYIHSFSSSLSLLRGNEGWKRISGSLVIRSPVFSLFLNIMWWWEKGKRLLSLY